MAYFSSSQQLQKVLGNFFKKLLEHPEIGPKLRASQLKLKFKYKEPDLAICIDLSQEPVKISFDDDSFKQEVQMTMKADVAHRFWLGKVNLLAALARREIIPSGPIPKILKLLPVIKPAYALYPEYLRENGFEELSGKV